MENQEKYSWLQEVIKAEEKVEETGIVDFDYSLDPERALVSEALKFLQDLRIDFEEAIEIFNEMKPTVAGRIKLYVMNKTGADFMLFRNGFKLMLTLTKPGAISIKIAYPNNNRSENETIEVRTGAFNDMIWMHNDLPVRKEKLVRHFLVKFIRESVASGEA